MPKRVCAVTCLSTNADRRRYRSRKDAQSPHLVAHLLLDYTAQPLARYAKDALIIPADQLSNAASSPFRIFTSP
jgi:hypothetical protein